MLGGRNLELTRRLDQHLGGDTVVDHERKALATHSHAESTGIEFQSERARIFAIAVGEHLHGRAGIGTLSPGVHHVHVVDRHAGDGVDPLGPELGGLAEVAGQVLGGAGRRKGTGDGKQHHPLAAEQVGGAQVLRTLVTHDPEFSRGHAVAGLDRHGSVPPRYVACQERASSTHSLARRAYFGSLVALPKALLASALFLLLSYAIPSSR